MKMCADVIIQKQIIENALNNFRDIINLHIEFYPVEIQKMLKYIHKHLFEKTLTIEGVKTACKLTNHNITTKFKNCLGEGAREYIVRLRLTAAASILHYKSVNVYLIAEAVGYTEEAFSKLFKKTFGCSALHYRQNILREMDKKNGQEKITREMDKSL